MRIVPRVGLRKWAFRTMPMIPAALAVILVAASAVADDPAPTVVTLEESDDLRWYRGNLHTHSHWSDGDDYLESIALWYRDRGYHFLSFTDHNVLPDVERWVDVEKSKGGRTAYEKLKAAFPGWVEERETDGRLEVRLRRFDEVAERFAEPGRFLPIQGEEISDKYEKYPIHMNATHVRRILHPRGGTSVRETIQNNLDAVHDERARTGEPILVHLNHPNFGYAVTAEDLMRLVGERFFEVYNGHSGVNNSGDETHASTERVWDVVLTKRVAEFGLPLMYGLAVDDGHNYHQIPSPGRRSEPGRGWVQVLAGELSPRSLIDSLETGLFYASSGVALRRIAATGEGLSVEVEPDDGAAYSIAFVGTRRGYDPEGRPVLDEKGNELRATRIYDRSIGETFETVSGTAATYRFRGDEIYVRAVVTSSQDHPNPSETGEKERAWVQPVLGPAAPKDAEANR